jgi:hypothetical protein
MPDWLDILENHFDSRKKAFLIFDDKHVLQYISGYAKEILGIEDDHLGYMSFFEIFPSATKSSHFLLDEDHSFQTLHNVLYTMPSGRPQELRISKESQMHTISEKTGYIVWIEARARDISGIYRRVSAFDPFRKLAWLFEQNHCGFMLVDREGILQSHNERIKKYLPEPGEWQGRNIFSFSAVHQMELDRFFSKIMKHKKQPETFVIADKNGDVKKSQTVKWTCVPLSDMEGSFIGAIITVLEENSRLADGF